MRKGTLLVGCLFAVAAAAGPSQAERRLARDLDRIFSAPAMEQGLWGVEVKSIDSGRVLYARNPRTLLMPASNMKILTLCAAAETLGWDYRFTTRIAAEHPIQNGVLPGPLLVYGSGDPTINARNDRATSVFDEIATALKRAGIIRVAGGIVGVDNAFDAAPLGQGWSWDYLEAGYAAPVGALEYNENVAHLLIRPGTTMGEPAAMELTAGTGLRLVNRLTTGTAESTLDVDVMRPPTEAALVVTGSIPVGSAPVTRDVAVANPTLYFAQALKDALVVRGIAVDGPAADADDPPVLLPEEGGRTLATVQSPPLREIASVMIKVSQNLYAETLLKAVGAARQGVGSAAAGRKTAADVFAAWGITPGTYVQADGSGLSRYDYVTADMIVALLEHMYRDPKHKDAFVATLPVAGRDGTVASRLKHTRAEANAAAKTGSISNVRALSGYVRTRDGETLAFSILANNFAIPAATVNYIADVAVEALANHSR